MELARWSVIMALVSISIALIVALAHYLRGKTTAQTFWFTAIALSGLTFCAVNQLVEFPKPWYWLGLAVFFVGTYKLRDTRPRVAVRTH